MANITRLRALSLCRFAPPFRALHPSASHLSSPRFFSISTSATSQLYTRIELGQDQVVIQGRELAIVQPTDVDQVLDVYVKQGKLEGDPYWCRIWPSACVLADEILKHPQLVAESCVCDLGSGLGLAGLAALLAGAKEVVFYDQEPMALLCSLLTVHANVPNAITNLPILMELICSDSDQAAEYIEYLAGGLALPPEVFYVNRMDTTLSARAEVFDWSKKILPFRRFDTVIACDVLYEKKSLSYLAEVLPKLVKPSFGKVIMADPKNRTPQNRREFLSLMQDGGSNEGLKLEKITQQNWEVNGKIDDVEVMHFCHLKT